MKQARSGARAITIIDVAREAEVSIRTVSRVLNNERHVSEVKRVRVQEVIARLAFIPSAGARALPGGKSYTFALLFERLSANYLVEIQLAAVRTCHANGHRLLVEELTAQDLASPEQAMAAIASLRIDGAVLLPPACDNPLLLDALDALAIRHTRLGPSTDLARAPAVTFDDAAATVAMVEHLATLGHRRIGFVVGNSGHGSSHRRLDAFHAAMQARGLPHAPDLIRPGDYSHESGVAAGLSLLDGEHPPSAIFASNDAMATGVVAAAGMRGLLAPRDLSICGFDDSPLAHHIWPPLTTIRQPLTDMATAAIEQLLFPQRRDRTQSFDFTLVRRASTTVPPRTVG